MSRNQANKKKSSLPLIIICGVLLLAVVGGALLMNSNRSGSGVASGGPNTAQTQPAAAPRPNPLPGADPPRAKGPESAAVTLEEFGDYQCPSCGVFNPVVKKMKDTYGDRLRVVFRHLPLQSIHRNAAMAARAAEAAGLQGRFWEMHDTLYDNQKEWSDLPDPRPKFAEYAQRSGVPDVERFKTELESPNVSARIVADVRRATSLGITGTPSVLINGVPVRGITESELRREIETALAGAVK
jgi:protein-disulfide isomerase